VLARIYASARRRAMQVEETARPKVMAARAG